MGSKRSTQLPPQSRSTNNSPAPPLSPPRLTSVPFIADHNQGAALLEFKNLLKAKMRAENLAVGSSGDSVMAVASSEFTKRETTAVNGGDKEDGDEEVEEECLIDLGEHNKEWCKMHRDSQFW